jgi:hypothetical protein
MTRVNPPHGHCLPRPVEDGARCRGVKRFPKVQKVVPRGHRDRPYGGSLYIRCGSDNNAPGGHKEPVGEHVVYGRHGPRSDP